MGKTNSNSHRRLRTPNWSLEEKQHLLELIKARKTVVVTKSNNGPNFSEEKGVAWTEILRELEIRFGAKFNGSSINIKKVKTQWQNMKRLAREEVSLTGPLLHKLCKQTVEVCEILDMVKDGVLKMETSSFNDSTTSSNIEIKTERIDEEGMPTCSGPSTAPENPEQSTMVIDADNDKENVSLNCMESSTSSGSEPVSVNDLEICEEAGEQNTSSSSIKKNASAMTMTDEPFKDASMEVNPFHKEMQDYFKFISAEKLMKMESIKEERQVTRALRETAELNKIIAEQKLKHVLWVKKAEMAMYTGDGSGVGHGGGGGGAIRSAGGSFGKMGAAREEQYFNQKQKEQLRRLKSHLDTEIEHHRKAIERHEAAIKRTQGHIEDMAKKGMGGEH